MKFLAVAALAGVVAANGGCPAGAENKYTATGVQDVLAAQATAKTTSPTSNVKGKAFDRIAHIWFENQNYDKSIGDPNFKFFADKGILLDSYFAVTHPSQPNYMAAVLGDYFGMQNDDFLSTPYNVSSVIDLLQYRGISWGFYQEDMPYSGFEGYGFKNQQNGRNDYVRKHNPGMQADSITHWEQRLSQNKNLSVIDTSRSMFHKDLAEDKLPQWMFITPNMTSDGHDTDITTAGKWLGKFLTPLLDDKKFMKNTLVVITFDENETYAQKNHILAILIGDAVPKELVGTTDNNFYNHYSEIATVSANWDLPTLGRWDVGANVYQMVAKKTGDTLRKWASADVFNSRYYNYSYAGHFNTHGGNPVFPAPNLDLDNSFNGRKILSTIKKRWAGSTSPSYYKDTIELPDGLTPPKDFAPIP